MKNVLVVTNMYPSKINPMKGIFVQRICEGLRAEPNLHFTLVSPRFSAKLLSYIFLYLDTLWQLLWHRPDTIYCHFVSHTGALAWFAKTCLNLRAVVHCHGSDILSPLRAKGLMHRLNKRYLQFADVIVVPSAFFKRTLTEEFVGITAEKIVVSPSGGVHVPEQVKRAETEICQIGFVAHQVEMKGKLVLLSALAQCEENIVLHLAGAGDTSEYDTLNNPNVQIQKHGILGKLELQSLYSQLDVLVFPTLYEESLGLTPIEAMAYGVPVISSKIGVSDEYIIHGENGYVFTKGSAEELQQLLSKFMQLDISDKQKMQHAAHIMARKYCAELTAKELNKIFVED